MFMFRKNRAIREKIEAYLGAVSETLECFRDGMNHYFEHGLDDHFHALAMKTHDAESRADDLRLEIDHEMFGKSLLPESREDITRIIRHIDRVANQADDTLARLWSQNLLVPDSIKPKLRELADVGITSGKILTDEVLAALDSTERVHEMARRIDGQESIGDQLENEMIYRVFHEDLEPADRILYRDAIVWVGSITDLVTRVSEELIIFAIKRQI